MSEVKLFTDAMMKIIKIIWLLLFSIEKVEKSYFDLFHIFVNYEQLTK